MKVSYIEDLANHNGPESCAGAGNCVGEALTGEDAGQVLNREMLNNFGAPTLVDGSGRPHQRHRYREMTLSSARSQTLSMHRNTSRGNREIPWTTRQGDLARIENSKEVKR
jgi:hypothetical protein